MLTLNNVHQQFASWFHSEKLRPFAYLVSRKLSEGHICVALNDIDEEEENHFPLTPATFSNYETLLKNEPLVMQKGGTKQPFVLHNHKLYLQRYFHYETIILDRIYQFLNTEKTDFEHRKNSLLKLKELVHQLFPSLEKKITNEDAVNWQMVAALNAVLNNFTIITGGPGTGKTTTVARLLTLLAHTSPLLKVALAAPTGKAAARMAESLKASMGTGIAQEHLQSLIPLTLHRLLRLKPGSTTCPFNATNPLDYDVIIVDESSMIDVALFARLLHAVGSHSRLILLGDKSQLASVEAGSLFGDLCNARQQNNLFSKERIDFFNHFIPDGEASIGSDKADNSTHPLFQHVVELQHSHRFSGSEGIGRFSRAIIRNEEKILSDFFEKDYDNQITLDPDYNTESFEKFVLGYKEYIEERDTAAAIKKFNQLRVLCAVREGNYGLYAINKKIEVLLQQRGLITASEDFYKNRPIMITRNYYELQLFNGDVGIIRPDETGVLKAWFFDNQQNLRSVLPAFIATSETVFAMTIHKSQGSEFDKVLVLLPDNQNVALLTRELLYTAVTRAKEKVLIQGSKEVIRETAKRRVKRVSGILERFHDSSE